jgi:polyhydroxybutyrate depolymerase
MFVHPKGLTNVNGDTHWNYGNSTGDDIGFINALYDKLVIDYNINIDRVYSVGMSNGGAMSYYLSCEMSDKIAAIASVTGAMTFIQLSSCNPIHPTPILQIHGTNDTIVGFSSMIFGLDYWKNYNNCDLIADTISIPDYVLSDSSTVDHIIFKNGNNGVTTELYKVYNGGHTWPGTSAFFNNGVVNYDIDASVEIWKFFSKYDISGLINQTSKVNEFSEHKKLIKIIDVFGRESEVLKNLPLFYIYNDGTVEKKLIIE